MPYFTNRELAYTYHVSDRTVRNWIDKAREGKLPLELETVGSNSYVSKTSGNIKVIEGYVAKYKNRRPHHVLKAVSPKPKFYKLFTQAQIYDIVRNLEMHHEIPRQYNYFDGGATRWDEYVKGLGSQDDANLLNRTVELISENQGYLDKRLDACKMVNVVDVGVGNAQPAKNLLQHLLDQGKLARYIAIDISAEMLEIARHNIKEWFGGSVHCETYEMDVTHERFANILAEDYLKEDVQGTSNIILFLGGTADNLRIPDDAFRTINESMNASDLLLYSNKLETADMRPQWFNYSSSAPGKLELAPMHRLVFDLLNIDATFYDVEMDFNEQMRQRYTRARLKVAMTLKFEFEDGERVIEFEKGETILIWRSWQMTAKDVADQFDRTGFYTLHSSQTDDREYILTVSQVRR